MKMLKTSLFERYKFITLSNSEASKKVRLLRIMMILIELNWPSKVDKDNPKY